ncbi:SRPBCC family protein [Moritella viscosa]|uniref:Orf144 n=1 Tax=Moritella viscosa TaxID=80854 RepID=A0A1K9ZX73_9GAMM|nr:SRPBCC family protein [Moritella viscosa]SGZ03942.1 Orf144 [Moritella viscosa]
MTFEESIEIGSTPEKVFSLYKDVSNWKVWDKEVKCSTLKGAFLEGSVGSLTPSKGPKAQIILSKVEENKSFTSKSNLPFCVMYFEHCLVQKNDTVLVVHRVSFKGAFSYIFGYLIGHSIKKSLPITLQGLKSLAENGYV